MRETLIQYTSHTGENIRVTLETTPMPIPITTWLGKNRKALDLLLQTDSCMDLILTFQAGNQTHTYQIDGPTSLEELQAYLSIPQLLRKQIQNHADLKTLHQTALNKILPLRYVPRKEDYLPGPEWNPPNWNSF